MACSCNMYIIAHPMQSFLAIVNQNMGNSYEAPGFWGGGCALADWYTGLRLHCIMVKCL